VPGWQKTRADRERDNQTYDARWRRARKAALERAGYRCEIRLPDVCAGRATEVDHISQAANDPNHRHLRAACSPCHAKVTAQQGRGFRKGGSADPPPRPRTEW
jgi:5-methylcytosine-specific restriction enzyme A